MPRGGARVGGGRKPKPAAVKLLDGNPGKRPIKEPIAFAPLLESCPAWLSDRAKAEWARVVPELERYPGLASAVDAAVMTRYVCAWDAMVEAELEVQATGVTITNSKGDTVYNPALKAAQQAGQELRMVCAEFGFTPAARQRIQPPQTPEKKDPMVSLVS
jgi:P27 family predicted phage terminase small subunit